MTITLNSTTDEMFGGDGQIDIGVTGGASPYSFDWDSDGTGDFDDPEDLITGEGGPNTVVVRDDADCEKSETFDLGTQLGIDENGLNSIMIYPNPTADNITIAVQGKFQYTITTVDGKSLIVGSGTDQEIVSLEKLADGVYIIDLTHKDKKSRIQIVKK